MLFGRPVVFPIHVTASVAMGQPQDQKTIAEQCIFGLPGLHLGAPIHVAVSTVVGLRTLPALADAQCKRKMCT